MVGLVGGLIAAPTGIVLDQSPHVRTYYTHTPVQYKHTLKDIELWQ
jgi:hypothetical protein